MTPKNGKIGHARKHAQFRNEVLDSLLDLGSLAETATQIVQLRSANLTTANGLDLDHTGAMEAGIDFLGVLYGFGFAQGNSYPFDTAATVADVGRYLDSGEGA